MKGIFRGVITAGLFFLSVHGLAETEEESAFFDGAWYEDLVSGIEGLDKGDKQPDEVDKQPKACVMNPSDPTIVEFRVSYFLPSSSVLRRVCDQGGVDYQLTGTVPVYQGSLFWARCFNFWWAVDYFHTSGRVHHVKTDVTLVPLTAGMKYIYARGSFRPYVGAGMKYYFVNVHNHGSHLIKKVYKNGMGGVMEGGALWLVNKHLSFNLFTSYSFRNFGAPSTSQPNVEPEGMQVGGWNFGGGIGYQF